MEHRLLQRQDTTLLPEPLSGLRTLLQIVNDNVTRGRWLTPLRCLAGGRKLPMDNRKINAEPT